MKRITEAMLNLPVCSCANLGIKIHPNDESDVEAVATASRLTATLDEYFADFAFTNGKCPACGETLGGLLGSFRWGICHGEGHCRCDWPCRGAHYPKDGDGEIFDSRLSCVLPYHPKHIEVNEAVAAELEDAEA